MTLIPGIHFPTNHEEPRKSAALPSPSTAREYPRGPMPPVQDPPVFWLKAVDHGNPQVRILPVHGGVLLSYALLRVAWPGACLR
jgi:hypothetical protein